MSLPKTRVFKSKLVLKIEPRASIKIELVPLFFSIMKSVYRNKEMYAFGRP